MEQNLAIRELTINVRILSEKVDTFTSELEKLKCYLYDPDMLLALRTIKDNRHELSVLFNQRRNKTRLFDSTLDKIFGFVVIGVLTFLINIVIHYMKTK